MNHHTIHKNKIKVFFLLISIIVLLIFVNLNNLSNSTLDMSIGEQNTDSMSDLNIINKPKVAANEPNGKPLLVNHYANTSKIYSDSILPNNISFTLVQGWTSKNINVSYEGVSVKKDIVINGSFDSNYHGWSYETNTPAQYIATNGSGDVDITLTSGLKVKGEYGYFERNVSISEQLSSDKLGLLSFDCLLSKDNPSGISAYLAIIIDGVEKNVTYDYSTQIPIGSPDTLTMVYDPKAYGQELPGNVTIRVGVYTESDTTVIAWSKLRIDNIKFDLWTMPNQINMVNAYDIEFGTNSSYINTTFGKGYSFIDVERTHPGPEDIIFTISKNVSGIDDFDIDKITIISNLVKKVNSSINGIDGSLYTSGIPTTWATKIIISMPIDYVNNRAEILKPVDWNITQILDGYDVNQLQCCTGTNPGSSKFIIPNGVLDSGLWKIEATSQNYISNGSMSLRNGSTYYEASSITYDDEFRINVNLNDTISLTNSQINCTILYPNGTIYYEKTKVPGSYSINFGDFTVGNNMSVGIYQTTLLWTNNQSYLERDKIGFIQFGFNVWHHTNLTAVNSYEEKVSGEPYLMKVNFTDYDSNTYIDFATINYNFTDNIGQLISFGTMVYFGSGIYVYDMDLSDIDLGDYYCSFNASKQHFQNQTIKNLIHVVIINQSMVLEVPQTAIVVDANNYATFRVNVTGALSGTLLPGAVNITTDWHTDFTVTGSGITGNGIIYLNFSTYHVPAQGIIETFTISIFANKTNFGSASAFISLTVNPITTIVNVNETIIDVYLNSSFLLKLNYTIASSDEVISDATLNVSWASSFNVLQVVDGYIVNFSTTNLSLDVYTILFELNHPGFETSYSSVYVNIIPKSTYVEIFLNQVDKTPDKSLTLPWNSPLNITVLYKESLSNQFISGASIELNGAGISGTMTQSQQQYSIIFSPGELLIGIHFLTITAQKENYNTVPSILRITVEQIEVQVNTPEFNGTLDVFAGDSHLISVILTEAGSGGGIENANVTYFWDFREGLLENMGDGTYETEISIPNSAIGAYTIEIIIRNEETQYRNRNFLVNIYVSRRPTTNYLIIVIIIALLSIVGVLGTLSLRSYVIVPRKKKRDRIFQNTIQVFKDVKNIQAVMFIQRNSGMPFYNKNYATFDSKDNFLLSGFIQAITLFGEQMIHGGSSDDQKRKQKEIYSKNIIELNFKFFHLLICDYQSVRSLLILREKSSRRLKKQFYLLSVEIDAKLGNKIENFNGKLEDFESDIDILLNEFLSILYLEPYKLLEDPNYMQYLKKSRELHPIEARVLNVIIARSKFEKEFTLNKIVEEMDEKNVDLIYGGLHTLIGRNIIVPRSYKKSDSHPLLGGFK